VTAPISDLESSGFAGVVSVGIRTSGDRNILNGGIFKDDVALHFVVGQGARGTILYSGSSWSPISFQYKDKFSLICLFVRLRFYSTISSAVGKLRKILADNKGKDSLYGKAANGTIPIVVHIENKVSC
jgi:hypothetical protein